MARDERTDTTSHISLPAGTKSERESPLYDTVVAIVNLLNGKLSLGRGENQVLTGNIVGVVVDVLTPATPDSDFVVYHKLDFLPEHAIIVKADRAAIIYISPTQSADNTTLTLRCNVASATLKIWIF